jgi:pyruvate dehydrogenase E1 component
VASELRVKPTAGDPPDAAPDIELLELVQQRVLWLAMSIIHHANKVRKTPSGVEVGGH